MGRLHQRPVGPHPQWSCQLAFRAEALAAVLPWLLLNRDDLTVLLHPLSGEPLADHRDRALWLGSAQPLDLVDAPRARRRRGNLGAPRRFPIAPRSATIRRTSSPFAGSWRQEGYRRMRAFADVIRQIAAISSTKPTHIRLK